MAHVMGTGSTRFRTFFVATQPAYQAYQLLHIGFAALPIVAGLDKFFHLLANWDAYLAPVVSNAPHWPPNIASRTYSRPAPQGPSSHLCASAARKSTCCASIGKAPTVWIASRQNRIWRSRSAARSARPPPGTMP